MTYEETLNFLYERLPMFTRIGAAAYKKDLHNTIALLERLGNPHKNIKTIHIAGTNGKGSTSHMLAAIFQANGYKTGLYTSPHLREFGERIKINGEYINQQFVIDFVTKINQWLNEIEPSFFEATVGMAFDYFAEQKVDIAIIETGLGGRLDSTNVISPELSIITNIGWDHMNLLGNSLDKIAYEKAGIIKKETPVISGETLPETQPVFIEKAAQENSSITFSEEEWTIENFHQLIDLLSVTLKKGDEINEYVTDLTGLYQRFNLRTVVTAIDKLQQIGWELSKNETLYALQNVKLLTGLHGRWEIIQQNPCVVLDVGHNEDGVKQILQQINHFIKHATKPSQIHIVMGMVKDKEVEKVLNLFPKDYRFYFTNAHLPRAMQAEELCEKAATIGLMGDVYDDVNVALKTAISKSSANDLTVVCGSVFVVGEVNTAL
jgi:dihydrofolate synthase/folylpolyglutamate synthase